MLDRNSVARTFASKIRKDESGQSIVLIAFAFMGLMAFVGLAVDASFLYVRSAQLTAAIDSATSAGVTELRENPTEEAAYARAAQFLNVNGWPTATATYTDTDLTITPFGAPQFTLTVTWPIPMNFMQLFGFGSVDVTRSATAALIARPEVFTPTSFEWGVARKANLFAFGPNHCTKHGDPIAPLWADNGVENPYYHMPEKEGVHQFRIRVGQDYVDEYGMTVRIELFDPDTYNAPVAGGTVNHTTAYQDDGGPETEPVVCTISTPGAPCVVPTDEIASSAQLAEAEYAYHNALWFLRVDEGWSTDSACPAGPDTTDPVSPVNTRFDLYYYDMSTGVPIRQDLARYETADADKLTTDMKWVTPGVDFVGASPESFGSFEVDLSAIPTDANDFQQIYLDVIPMNGYSKNVFDIWARPPSSTPGWDLPADINTRNVHILDELYDTPSGKYDIDGLDVFALGRMPLNPHIPAGWNDVEFALVPLDQELQVSSAFANLFDYDIVGENAHFSVYLEDNDGNPDNNRTNYGQRELTCDGGCDNDWAKMTVSTDLTFGILTVRYPPKSDAHTWSLVLTSGAPILTR